MSSHIEEKISDFNKLKQVVKTNDSVGVITLLSSGLDLTTIVSERELITFFCTIESNKILRILIKAEREQRHRHKAHQAEKAYVDRKQFDVVVSGKGPVGLAAAFNALKAGKNVLLINDRSIDSLRPQSVRLSPRNKLNLFDMLLITGMDRLEDRDFVTSLREGVFVGIKDLERFLLRRCLYYTQSGSLEIQTEAQLSQIGIDNGFAVVTSVDGNAYPILFDCMVAADGAHNPEHKKSIDRVNEYLPQADKIKHERILGPYVAQHLSGNFIISRADGKPIDFPKDGPFLAKVNKGFIHTLFLERKSHKKSDRTQIKVSFSGEVPEHINKESMNNGVADEYLKTSTLDMLRKYDVIGAKDEINIKFTKSKEHAKKDSLKKRLFSTDKMMKVSTPILERNGHTFVVMGDANRGSNYQLGHGVNDGLTQARVFFRTDEANRASVYTALIQNQGDNVELKTAPIGSTIKPFRLIAREIYCRDVVKAAIEEKQVFNSKAARFSVDDDYVECLIQLKKCIGRASENYEKWYAEKTEGNQYKEFLDSDQMLHTNVDVDNANYFSSLIQDESLFYNCITILHLFFNGKISGDHGEITTRLLDIRSRTSYSNFLLEQLKDQPLLIQALNNVNCNDNLSRLEFPLAQTNEDNQAAIINFFKGVKVREIPEQLTKEDAIAKRRQKVK